MMQINISPWKVAIAVFVGSLIGGAVSSVFRAVVF